MIKKAFWLLPLFLALLLLFLPYLFSTNGGKEYLANLLGKKFHSEVTIGALSLHWSSPQILDNVTFKKGPITFEAKEIQYNASLYSLLFQEVTLDRLILDQGTLSTDHLSLLVDISFAPKGTNEVAFRGSHPLTGNLALEGTYVKNKWLTLSLSHCPTNLFDLFSPLPLSPLIGKEIDGDIEWMEGAHASFKLHSEEFSLNTTGTLRDGHYFLTSPLTLSCILTPPFMKNLFPTSRNLPFSQGPVSLQIAPENAFIALKPPLSFASLHFPQGVLNLGILEIERLSLMTNLFSLIDLSFHFDRSTSFWFQSMPFSLTNSLFQIERTEFLVDQKYLLALWNTIDLGQKKLDLYIGLTSPLLKTYLGLDFLPADYTIPVHVTGPLDDPRVDKGPPLKTIAALLLINKAPIRIAPPPWKQAPKPRPPFPWQGRFPR